MVAFTSLICERQTRLHFSHGEVVGDMTKLTVTDFKTTPPKVKTYHPPLEGGGHGGGDLGLISSFVKAVKSGKQEILGTDIDEVLRSHLSVFAAEKSRLEGRVIDIEDFEKDAKAKFLKAA